MDSHAQPRFDAAHANRTISPGPAAADDDAWVNALEIALRSALFLGVFWFFWISTKAFPDYSDPRVLLPSTGGDEFNQALALVFAGLCAIFALGVDARRYMIAFSLPLALTLGWIAVSAVLSPHAALALKKFALALLIILEAATLLLLPVSKRHFAILVAIGFGGTLAMSFFGIVFLPELAIHQPTDLLEPQLAGDWRGSFQHKNEAGNAAAMILFFAIFLCRSGFMISGSLIAAGATLLLIGSGSKTPMGMLGVALLATWAMLSVRTQFARLTIAALVVVVPASLTIGSAFIPALHSALGAIGIDPTFTDRTDIWRYAIGEAMSRPLLGHGFHAFWGTTDVFNSSSETWATKAVTAHSAFVDAFLQTGIVGLGLLLYWMVVTPALDLDRSRSTGGDRTLDALYTNIWVFMMLLASLESVFFVGGGPVWITTLLALFGLRYQGRARLAGVHDAPDDAAAQAHPEAAGPLDAQPQGGAT